ncbi:MULTISPECIES: MarR family winged helix-turn-helix transcriptional regulator [Streptomyces]|jgi:DNA-binding MarR family transcriptional regulator|uniref:DNA-binding MarR family transcriptional regulator n=1 Tax=Streptomyces nymphaeiformis TaxID=2663842 RepID=A0A7W7XF05_9ACTN|nr:MarR family transcriptional regulator [Streptomyces nymphaeiformis]MBB4986419.1 DNA-binding MarR family transcriptional regulator [Streptomyces nymphaeiformis]
MESDAIAAIVDQWKRERPDLDATPMLVIGRLFRLTHALDQQLRPPFAAAGLGSGDFDLLAALRRAGEPYALSAGDLSRTALVTTGAITKRVDRLEARGLVARTVDEADSRGRLITLTAEGVALTDELIAVHLDNQRRLLAGLGTDEQAHLADLLERLALTLRASDG